MRSYYEHLETATGQTRQPVPPKPTLRSSAIFPMIHLPGVSSRVLSRVLFMGYWILKRNIREIAAVATLRSEKGELLHRFQLSITEPKTYRIELDEQLKAAGLPLDHPFFGTLEIEFFSTVHLVFPFPAVVINYYGPSFSAVVHTAQRVYNDFEDKARNSQTSVPESGFNIYADHEREPFIGLINGPAVVEKSSLQLEFFNAEGQMLAHTFSLGRLAPYELRMIYPGREVDLKTFLNGKAGAAKARFEVNWIFPRLVVGNIDHALDALAITHTYYDTSDAKTDSDYWRTSEPGWHDASLMVPVSIADGHFTNVYFYPIYSPSTFAIDVEIYNGDGKLLDTKESVLEITSPGKGVQKIDMQKVCSGIPVEPFLAARLIARPLGSSRLPARIKLGLDIGREPVRLPCNICTNLQPFNPALEAKPKSFRWSPLLADQPYASLWIMNSSPQTDYKRTAEVKLTFFRETDAQTLTRTFTLPPHGFRVLLAQDDSELQNFLGKSIGWMTAETTNP
ncbi:MAG: hypothetical protein LLG04_03040, partial [Parachlamydia sp.]|nr:hypothetical protein [Parachlamydia sp.]